MAKPTSAFQLGQRPAEKTVVVFSCMRKLTKVISELTGLNTYLHVFMPLMMLNFNSRNVQFFKRSTQTRGGLLLLFIVLLMHKGHREQLKDWLCLGTSCLLYYYIYIRNTNIFLNSYCTHFFRCRSSNYCLNRNLFWSYILNFSIHSSNAKRILFKINKILFSYVA